MAIERDGDDAVGPGAASAPDLDVWRAEAGACAPLDAAATRGPWRSTWGDDEEADAERGKKGEEVTIEAVGLKGYERLVLGVTWYDGPNPCCREEDAAFIAAARTGWPRDAARVGVLADMLARAQAILDALPHCLGTWVKGSGGHCVYANDCDKIATVYEDGADGYNFCDEHGARNILDKFREEYLWADAVRALDAGTAAAGGEPTK